MPVSLRMKERLGAGAVSTVYRAVETTSGRLVALKKSRVSQKAKRPALKYEATIMRLLRAHPSIPTVFAYSHPPHFEYLSMQLLAGSLSDAVEKRGPLPVPVVANVAVQMLSALEHLHGFSLVHRDVKPDNIMLRSSDENDLGVCLIDFGMVATSAADVADVDAEPYSNLTGTLPYASLQAHVTPKLSYRDDLESLAYTLFELLLGSLPWAPYCGWGGTHFGRARQVYQQKMAYDGKKLAGESIPIAFADLLDTSRRMSANERPDYEALRSTFSPHTTPQTTLPPLKSNASTEPDSDAQAVIAAPVVVGQVVVIQVSSRLSIETPSLRGNGHSFIPDPSLNDDDYRTTPRLGVVTSIRQERQGWTFNAVGIGRLPREAGHHVLAKVVGTTVSGGTDLWTNKDAVFYAFRHPLKFNIQRSQAVVPKMHWVSESFVEQLQRELTTPCNAIEQLEHLKSTDPDLRYDARIQRSSARVYVELAPVPSDADVLAGLLHEATTSGGRGWFDEYVRVVRRLEMDDGDLKWTGAPFAERARLQQEQEEAAYWSESYMEVDYEEWQPVNRNRSVTLTLGGHEGLSSEEELLKDLDTIESVVDES
ncbi:kinase-like protein [Exidia glandulosa HHB12029]|uniref:non-specific serine/threonine protein kinase n=1 Tax=Exidia glandulosa HHB12029 TaxID=1314781 RepID=A0A165QZ32_EXIGL|nr:kinase-like protein [Exidia glandulosa HHB12029]